MTEPRPIIDEHGRGILTVRHLMMLLADCDPDAHVVIDNDSMRGTTDGWWTNIAHITIPADPDEEFCVTLHGGAELSSIQF
jgi:hypothetical protein